MCFLLYAKVVQADGSTNRNICWLTATASSRRRSSGAVLAHRPRHSEIASHAQSSRRKRPSSSCSARTAT